MKNKQNKILTNKFIFIIIILLIVAFIFIFKMAKRNSSVVVNQSINNQINNVNFHTSQDLKISYQYPIGWDVTDENYNILITNYVHNPHSNYRPKINELEIQISIYNLCSPTLDQDLVFWGCGEGNQVANKILEKSTHDLQSGQLSRYMILYPQTNTKQTLYYLQKNSKILQISKEPEPSQFDKEFNEIINSIKFL